MSHPRSFKQIYYKATGYSYTHMGRMFLRLFVGLMLMQLAVRQIIIVSSEGGGPEYMAPVFAITPLWISIVEIFCAFCIMIGFLTRGMIVPVFALMVYYACYIFIFPIETSNGVPLDEFLMIPFLFMGIFFFLLMVGPGKISIDYFLSLYLINRSQDKEEDLEEV